MILRRYYYSAVSIIMALAFYLRMQAGCTPLSDPDIEGYLYPALSWLSGHSFLHLGRAFPYPFFCTAVLALSSSFRVLIFIQYTLSVLSLWILAALLRSWILHLRPPLIISHILAIFFLFFWALLPQQMIFEASIRPEALTSILFCSFFYLLSIFVMYREQRGRLLIPLIVYDFFLFLIFPRWGFATALVGVVLAWYVIRTGCKKMSFLYVSGVMIAWLAFYLPEQFLITRYDYHSQNFPLRQYFYSHAGIIAHSLDPAQVHFSGAAEREAYRYLYDSLSPMLAQFSSPSLLGYDGDALMYGRMDDAIDSIYRQHIDTTLFYSDWGFHPRDLHSGSVRVDSLISLGFAHHVDNRYNASQQQWESSLLSTIIYHSIYIDYRLYAVALYSQVHYYYAGHLTPVSLCRYQVQSIRQPAALLDSFHLYRRVASDAALWHFQPIQARFCNAVGTVIRDSYLILFVVFLFIGAAVRDRLFFQVCIILLLHFSLALTVAVIHTFDLNRYHESICLPAIFSYFLLLIYCLHHIEAVRSLHASKK